MEICFSSRFRTRGRLDGVSATVRRCAGLADDRLVAATDLLSVAAGTPAVQALRRRVEEGGALSCAGLASSAQPFLAALLHRLFPQRSVVVVVSDLKAQEIVHRDLETWLSSDSQMGADRPTNLAIPVHFYPAWEILPHDDRLPHADVVRDRVETLLALTSMNPAGRGAPASGSPVVVTSVAALMQRTFPPPDLRRRTRRLERGDRLAPLDLAEWLEEQGYESEAQVTRPRESSLRGGILDVFPITGSAPIRLEFFGDELESLRQFDPLTQISGQTVTSVTLPPAGELGLLKRSIQASGEADRVLASTPSLNPSHPHLATFPDYLSPGTVVLLCEPEALARQAASYETRIPDADPFFVPWEQILDRIQAGHMTQLDVLESASMTTKIGNPSEHEGEITAPEVLVGNSDSLTLTFQTLDAYRPLGARGPSPQVAEVQRREFFAQLHRWLRQGHSVHIFFNNDGERDRFVEIQKEYGFSLEASTRGPRRSKTATNRAASLSNRRLRMHLGSLARGFLFEEGQLVVVTDAEIFGRYKIQSPRRLKSPHAQTARSALDIDFAELEEGDLVVHIQHGIGRFLGLRMLPVGSGRTSENREGASAETGQECLVIEYATSGDDQSPPKLYVPVTEAHLVSKYVGAGKARPPLSTLGGTRWNKTKAQAEQAVRDLAGELLAIQAARDSLPGHAFGADVPWQREFENAFIYEETADQARAIVDTKRDMEVARPMDRLICGDVGFGKTEVAIRAAFKAVMGGKQVAVLVPTTVLAQQHFNTFTERMADYPVRVELLSRFRSRRQQQQVVRELASGAVDIVVGTHRLLQADIEFKELGLVVIDEEQRFGVLQKEKFKLLRKLVDVLTLSATPIPRTLYLALTGARDMSTISTPPQDRLPVETIVAQYDERIIRDAIQRELDRGGQVFFLHNRVMSIDTVARRLRALVPHARVVVGHGQMHSDELEEVMTRFVNGEADVLLSTTIIESGLDIPNANTIIIDRADRFGLSDLYQLRGRVGRYKHQAYAYLLLPRHAALLSDVRKRISAIRQHSTLGSGFKIAMRDLEIRGAGNLLGSEQSGHITAVGFELYCQLLKQSVSSLKGEHVKPRIEVSVRLDFLGQIGGEPSTPDADSCARLPVNYVADSRQRIDVYRKLAQLTDAAGVEAMRRELRDRFGPLPSAVEILLQVAEIRVLAGDCGITAVEVNDGKVLLTRNDGFITLGGKFPRLTKKDTRSRLKEIRQLLLAL